MVHVFSIAETGFTSNETYTAHGPITGKVFHVPTWNSDKLFEVMSGCVSSGSV